MEDGDCWDDPDTIPESFVVVGASVDVDEGGSAYVQFAAADVNPGFAASADTWYDGIDQDCAGNDDCDQDADGFWFDGLENGYCLDDEQDCDDEDATAVPTDDEEIFYKGEDDNCNLADEDGDADGDGYWAEDYEDRVAGGEYAVFCSADNGDDLV